MHAYIYSERLNLRYIESKRTMIKKQINKNQGNKCILDFEFGI